MSHRTLAVLLATLVVPAAAGATPPPTPTAAPSLAAALPESAVVVRVVDGTTLVVRATGHATEEHVRLACVEPFQSGAPRDPSSVAAQESAAFLSAVLPRNTQILLKRDATLADRDATAALVRYVVAPGNRSVNAMVVGKGYGFAATGCERSPAYAEFEHRARLAGFGLWGHTAVRIAGQTPGRIQVKPGEIWLTTPVGEGHVRTADKVGRLARVRPDQRAGRSGGRRREHPLYREGCLGRQALASRGSTECICTSLHFDSLTRRR